MGKDTFIYNLDEQLINRKDKDGKNIIKLGNGTTSETKDFNLIEYTNNDFIPNKMGYVLNTVGLGDNKGDLKDEAI